jgi:hypothetical protein
LVVAHPNSLTPNATPLKIRVALQPAGDSGETELGQLILVKPGIEEHVLALSDELLSRVLNQEVRILLRSNRTWIPAEAIPGSEDERHLSVQVLRIAFEP